MTVDGRPLTRREAIRIGVGVGAGLALGQLPLDAAEARSGERALYQGLITKPIPSSGERIPVVGIGTARRYDVGASDGERAPLREVIRNLPDLGGQLVDTAPGYGQAETVVGELIAEEGNRDQIFLATKVGAGRRSVEAAREEIERSRERLRSDRFDLLQVHNLGGVNEVLPILHEMKQDGQIHCYGITTTSARAYDQVVRLLRSEEMDFLQVDYAIDNRGVEERILPLAADQEVAVLTALPFGRGRVFGVFEDQPIPEWAAELGITSWAQFALKYNVSHPAVTCAIPGTATLACLRDNLGAATGELPDAATRERMAALVETA